MVKRGRRHQGWVMPVVQPLESLTLKLALSKLDDRPNRLPRQASLLLVDDDVAQLTALGELLRLYGLAVECATCGHEALAQIAIKAPDLLIVDVNLPDITGIDLVRQARRHIPDLRAALLTGYPPDHPMIARAIATAHMTYIAKPVDLYTLLDRLAVALH